MKTKMKYGWAGIFAGMVLTFAGANAATVIPITNSGFETDSIPTNGNQQITPSGWTIFSSVANGPWVGNGENAFGATTGIPGAYEGNQYFLAHAPSGHTAIRQDTGLSWADLTVGDTLTVSAYTTFRSDVSGEAQVYFWLNDNNGSGINSGAMTATDSASGVWTLRSWDYTVTEEALAAAAANSWGAVNVQIGILHGPGSGARQIAFDDVSLVWTPVPEPSVLMSGVLAGGLLLQRRRRSAKSH